MLVRPRRVGVAGADLSEAASDASLDRLLQPAALAAAASRAPELRQAGVWALGALATTGRAAPNGGPEALVEALARFPRNGEAGPHDMAFENAVAAAFRCLPFCRDEALARAAFAGLPLFLDVAAAREAHATALALLPESAYERARFAEALRAAPVAVPPPPWALGVLRNDLPAAAAARAFRRFGFDAAAARSAAQKALDDAAIVDPATADALGLR